MGNLKMTRSFYILIISLLIRFSGCRVLFLEEFLDKNFKLRWFSSIDNIDKQGNIDIGYGPMAVDQVEGQGLRTEEDYRFYLLSRKMKRKYSNKNKTLVIQYQVIFPALMECGGAYIKILGYDFEPTTFSSTTPYKIMFGPDVCGFAFENREVKAILTYKGKYYHINQMIRYHMSHIPQLFTFIIRPDNTYEIQINMSTVAKGLIGRDFRMLRPEFIRDKKAKPPKDYEIHEFVMDRIAKIPPHEPHPLIVVNPDYYRNATEFYLTNQTMYVANPYYMKPWHPPWIRNPKYKGPWVAPLIRNPNYNANDDFYLQSDLGGVGIDVWQMSSGVLFDNILITDNEKFARKFARDRWKHNVELVYEAERHARPYNQTMDEVNAEAMNEHNTEHQQFVDDSGQLSCYNTVESMKNTIFGPTQEQLDRVTQERNNRILQIREELNSMLSPLPAHSFFEAAYYRESITPPEPDYSLSKRLALIDSRIVTETVKYVTEAGLNEF